jgi:hypothetical protein
MTRWFAICLVGAMLSHVPSVCGDAPTYLILRAPTARAPHAPTHDRYPGRAAPVETHAYSYGWFGAQPRRHWSRHFGYYNHYREWSAR